MPPRRATIADWDDVFDINRNMYSGDDYLGTMYSSYLNRHRNEAMLWTHPGTTRAHAFLFSSILDDGRTVALRAGRSRNGNGNPADKYVPQKTATHHHHLAGSTILQLEAALIQKAKLDYPGVQRARLITSTAFPGYYKLFTEYDVVLTRPYLRLTIDVAQSRDRLSTADRLHRLDQDEIRQSLTSARNSAVHFNQLADTVLLAFIPYSTGSHTNVDIILDVERPAVFAAGDDVTECQSLSFGTKYDLLTDEHRVRYDLDLYSDGTVDDMGRHVANHVRHLSDDDNCKRDATLYVVFRDESQRRPLFDWCCRHLALDPAKFIDYRVQSTQTAVLYQKNITSTPGHVSKL